MMSLSVAFGLLPLAIWVRVPISWAQVGWSAVAAGLATMAHYCMTRAFRVAPLTVTQPVTFFQLIWARVLRALVFHKPVDGYVLLGAEMIMAAIFWVTLLDQRAALRSVAARQVAARAGLSGS